MENPTYLGDGVYAEFDPDDAAVILRTGDHRSALCDQTIYLEPEVIISLVKFLDQIGKERSNDKTRQRI